MRDLIIIVASGVGIGVSAVRWLELNAAWFYDFVDMLSKSF